MKNQKPNIVAIDINAVKSRMLEVRGQPVLLDRDVSAAGAGRFTAPGWVRDANGALKRETIHHMGRRLPDFDYSSRRMSRCGRCGTCGIMTP